MMLTTAQKVTIARGLSNAIVRSRQLFGWASADVVCRRQGVAWSLDLQEGVQLALYLNVYERQTARLLSRLVCPGEVVLDIGANVGAHALPLAQRVGPNGRVIAIEPSDRTFARLERNRRLNPSLANQLVTLQGALGAPGGHREDEYYSAWPLQPSPNLHPMLMGARLSARSARFSTLDALAEELPLSRVSLIKIDVDGDELAVLGGSVSLIARDRPVVVFEVCPYLLRERRVAPATVLEFFTSRGYRLFEEGRLDHPLDDPEHLLSRVPDGAGINLVAGTAERIGTRLGP